jgi:hypothetical protein
VLGFAFLGPVALLLAGAGVLRGADQTAYDANVQIAIEWKGVHPAGQIVVSDGALEKLQVVRGQGEIQGADRFSGQQGGSLRLGLQIKGTDVRYGKGGTIVIVGDKVHLGQNQSHIRQRAGWCTAIARIVKPTAGPVKLLLPPRQSRGGGQRTGMGLQGWPG